MFEVIGHRGAGELEPENTLSGFKRAFEIGCPRVELDVHITGDGKAAVIHDSKYRGIPIKDYTLEELKVLSSKHGEPVPELSDLFDFFCGKRLAFQIELKGEGSESVVPDLVKAFNMEGRIRYTSFVHHRVKTAVELTPGSEGGLLMCSVTVDPVCLLEKCGASYLHLSKEHISSSIVRELDSGGFGVIGWGGITDDEDFRFIVGAGALGATTDRPDLFMDFIERNYTGSLNR